MCGEENNTGDTCRLCGRAKEDLASGKSSVSAVTQFVEDLPTYTTVADMQAAFLPLEAELPPDVFSQGVAYFGERREFVRLYGDSFGVANEEDRAKMRSLLA